MRVPIKVQVSGKRRARRCLASHTNMQHLSSNKEMLQTEMSGRPTAMMTGTGSCKCAYSPLHVCIAAILTAGGAVCLLQLDLCWVRGHIHDNKNARAHNDADAAMHVQSHRHTRTVPPPPSPLSLFSSLSCFLSPSLCLSRARSLTETQRQSIALRHSPREQLSSYNS
jgi:hypothetical protein